MKLYDYEGKLIEVNGDIIGYTAGVYDMFHIGHLNLLKRAKERCDFLIAAVSTDELVCREKGKTPVIPYEERCKIVEAIRYVDAVVPQINKNKVQAWEKYRFQKMFVGSDWKGTDAWDTFEKQFASLDAQIIYLPHTDGISSTLIRQMISEQE